MMASTIPLRSTTTVSSQLTANLVGTFSNIPQIFSTPNVTATNGFRPSIPPKNSRVPAGDIDKLSLSKMNNQANGKFSSVGTPVSATGSTQPLPPPPPLPHPPVKGISNAQARTARKSAPSSSNRGDGYSTSSSGGGGKKSISGPGKNSKENRDRVFLNVNEAVCLSDGGSPTALTVETEGSTLMCSPQQTPLPVPSKQQLETRNQVQKAQQQESQSPSENGQIELTSPVVPAPPSFAGPTTQVAGTKRPVSPMAPNTFLNMLSGKPKRQKIATAKAAALANEPGMNADGSAIKKRKPRKNTTENSGKEKEKLGKPRGREKLSGQGVFAVMGDRCGPGETNSGTTVQQRLPNPPPPYQVPAHLQKQSTQQGQQTKRDPPIGHAAVGDPPPCRIKLVFPGGIFPAGQLQPSIITAASQIQSSVARTPNDVIPIYSSPPPTMLQQTTASRLDSGERRIQDACGKKPALGDDEWGRHQNTPITIDDGFSEEESPNDARSPSDNRGRANVEVTKVGDHQAKTPTMGCNYNSPGPMKVSEEFFAKCVDASLSDDERLKMLVDIQKFIMVLVEEAKKHCWVPKPSPPAGRYLRRQKDSSTLGKITELLEYMGVLTDEGQFITLDEWKGLGMPKFRGRFILQDYQDAWKETYGEKGLDNGTGLSGELQPPRTLDDRATDVDMPDVAGRQAASPVETCAAPQVTAAINIHIPPGGEAGEKPKEGPANDKLKGNLVVGNGSLQPIETGNSPPKLPISEMSAAPAKHMSSQPSQPLPGQQPSSPSNQIQAEANVMSASLKPTSDVFEVAAPILSSKGKRKRFVATSVPEFLRESKIGQEIHSLQTSSFDPKRQERNDPFLMRIAELNQEELRVKDDIDALVVKSKLEEKKFERRIAGVRIGAKSSVNGGESNTGLEPIEDLASSPIDWEEFRKVTRELRDFQDDTRRAELRLADKATRIAEEKQYLIQRRTRMRQMGSEPGTTPSFTTSEERSLGNEDSTAPTSAPSSVSGSSAPRLNIPLPIRAGARTAYPEMSVGHELLRALIPWATSFQETQTENASPVFTETGPNQTKSKKKPVRRKRHW